MIASSASASDASPLRSRSNLSMILGIYQIGRKILYPGEVPERSNGPVSKTGVRATVPRVRIPPSPLCNLVQDRANQRKDCQVFRTFLRFLASSVYSFSAPP